MNVLPIFELVNFEMKLIYPKAFFMRKLKMTYFSIDRFMKLRNIALYFAYVKLTRNNVTSNSHDFNFFCHPLLYFYISDKLLLLLFYYKYYNREIYLQNYSYYVAGCRDSSISSKPELFHLLVNIPAREITVAPHAKGTSDSLPLYL